MKYSFESKIRYSEIGMDGKLTLPSLIDYFQDCSNFQSEALGVGLRHLMRMHRAWVLAGWQILINRYPGMGEDVRISTWAYDFKAFQGFRNFTLETADGELLAAANSIWVYMDLEQMRLVRTPEEEVAAYGNAEALDLPFGSRKVRIPKEGGTARETITVMEHHLDTNCHVNNAWYVTMAQACLPKEFTAGGLRVEYKMQAHLADRIFPVCFETTDGYIVSLNNEEGKPYAVAHFSSVESAGIGV